MIVLIGESGAGKSSIEKELVRQFNYKKLVTYTTRPPRNGEVDGIDYFFISEEKFTELDKQNCFIETAEYNGWNYGTAKEHCTNDKVAVLTPSGLRQLRRYNIIEFNAFYIKVPRRERLIQVLQRGDDIEEAYRRNLSDVGQFDGVENEVDFTITNYNYGTSVSELARLIHTLCLHT